MKKDKATPADTPMMFMSFFPPGITMKNNFRHAALILLVATYPGFAEERNDSLATCRAIADERNRLACYDSIADASTQPPPEPRQARVAEDRRPVLPQRSGDTVSGSYLASHWELDPATKRGVFKFRPHRENYLIATVNSRPNETPYLPFRSLAPDAEGLSHSELAFQLGFKLKMMEGAAGLPLDLWFGYTQRSFWQASNQKASSPFRETDYQPEIMAVVPVNFNLLGLRGRFVNFGLVHQSNGQSSTLSRSWNRVYAQLGMERGNFSMLARIWQRIHEAAADDDNPDITNYLGRGDITGTYRRNGHEYSFLTRYNFQTDKGAVQLGWAFPLVSNLKGYIHLFSGYGYSLIDYNAYQRVLGLGVQVDF